MENYVTLLDSLFLPQGVALHMSMERHLKDYVLWVLCVDDPAYAALTKLQLPNVRLLRLSSVETNELSRVRPTRTKGEFCWTLTPYAPRFVFEADEGVERVTYLDADLWFKKSPTPIFEEFNHSDKHVLITDHAYDPEYDQSENSGQFCVQFMTFTRVGGEPVRQWWEDRCIEWCYARVENGKFGDQKYLDDWPTRFKSSVHVLTNKELVLAPWNAYRYPYSNALVWHFQGLRLVQGKRGLAVQLSDYPVPETTLTHVYRPYIKDLKEAISKLLSEGVQVREQAKKLNWIETLRYRLSPWVRAIRRINRPPSVEL
jgi:hypothetical protein